MLVVHAVGAVLAVGRAPVLAAVVGTVAGAADAVVVVVVVVAAAAVVAAVAAEIAVCSPAGLAAVAAVVGCGSKGCSAVPLVPLVLAQSPAAWTDAAQRPPLERSWSSPPSFETTQSGPAVAAETQVPELQEEEERRGAGALSGLWALAALDEEMVVRQLHVAPQSSHSVAAAAQMEPTPPDEVEVA
jgi:hypothetical protein